MAKVGRAVLLVGQWILLVAMLLVNYFLWTAMLVASLSDSGFLGGMVALWATLLLTMATITFLAVAHAEDWHLLKQWTIGVHLAGLSALLIWAAWVGIRSHAAVSLLG